MMAMLGQWLGFESSDPSTSSTRTSQPGIVIHENKSPKVDTNTADTSLRKTKSDELLRDFDVMRFLSNVDETVKEHGCLLPQQDVDRLQTLHTQASIDECAVLMDIIEHLEMEHDRLRHRLARLRPSSASHAMRRPGNALVF